MHNNGSKFLVILTVNIKIIWKSTSGSIDISMINDDDVDGDIDKLNCNNI